MCCHHYSIAVDTCQGVLEKFLKLFFLAFFEEIHDLPIQVNYLIESLDELVCWLNDETARFANDAVADAPYFTELHAVRQNAQTFFAPPFAP